MKFSLHSGRVLPAALIAVALTLSGCSSDPVDVEIEPEATTLRLIVGGTDTVDVDILGTTGGPIEIPVGSTSLQAQFLLDNGSPDPVVTATLFVLDVEPADENILTYTQTSAFAGTLNGLQAGATALTFELFHLGEDHEEWERVVPVVVE